jgi:hypothetical protein
MNSPQLDEKGSATSEFVLLALPLFIPALLFFISMANISKSEMNSSMLAREALAAFTSSENDLEGHHRTRLLLDYYSTSIANSTLASPSGSSSNTGEIIDYSVKCATTPCIQPGSAVEMTLYALVDIRDELNGIDNFQGGAWRMKGQNIESRRRVIATVAGYVDKWS